MMYQQMNMFIIQSFMILFVSSVTVRVNLCSPNTPSLNTLPLDGHFNFHEVQHAARDFGNRYQFLPTAVLHPKSVSDIATLIKHISEIGPHSELTVAARGHGHSLQGQSQAHRGVVVNMESLKQHDIHVYRGEFPYADVAGGELWINILHETLKYGLAPKSWTDYLHLTVGGTLSNAGVSGQAFRHGPQISNVHQLEVVTGKGEIITCSEKQNEDLFHGVLGGLGQFGIITRARILLEAAPARVKWIRVLYSDFATFTRDQEHLISAENTFNYVEGFVIINRTGLLNNWRSSFSPKDPVQASHFKSDGKTLYCLELAKYFNLDESDIISQEVNKLLSQLSYIPSMLFMSEVTYTDFLDRVHVSEMKLRSKDLWDIPHPWLNLLIPKSKIHAFAQGVFGNILTETSNGPILIYPVNRSKWDNRTSVVIPEENTFYLVAFLTSAVPSSTGTDGLDYIEVNKLLSQLSYIPSMLFMSEVTYTDFLDRVHVSEMKLRSKDLWDIPHPWLNLLIPKSKIHAFAQGVFGNILTETSNGPILIYPVNRSKWDNRTSVVIPEENTFYLVAFLTSAVPSSTGTDGLDYILSQNKRIIEFCETSNLGVKQYLPHQKATSFS